MKLYYYSRITVYRSWLISSHFLFPWHLSRGEQCTQRILLCCSSISVIPLPGWVQTVLPYDWQCLAMLVERRLDLCLDSRLIYLGIGSSVKCRAMGKRLYFCPQEAHRHLTDFLPTFLDLVEIFFRYSSDEKTILEGALVCVCVREKKRWGYEWRLGADYENGQMAFQIICLWVKCLVGVEHQQRVLVLF